MFYIRDCSHANIQVRIDSIKNELFKSVIARETFTSIMRFLNFGEDSVNEDDRLGKSDSS